MSDGKRLLVSLARWLLERWERADSGEAVVWLCRSCNADVDVPRTALYLEQGQVEHCGACGEPIEIGQGVAYPCGAVD